MNTHVTEVDTELFETPTREHTLGDILEHALRERIDDKTPPIPQVPVALPTVDAIIARFTNQWTKTADQCIIRAQELENAARDLRDRADQLNNCSIDFPPQIKEVVHAEIEARQRAASLALVNPTKDD